MKNAPLPYLAMLLITGLCTLTALSQKAAPAPVRELRIQQVGNLTYFHVQLEAPRDLMPEGSNFSRGFFSEVSPSLAPRLVPADGQVRLVCRRIDRNGPNGARFGVAPPVEPGMDELENISGKGQPRPGETRRQPAPVQGLEFVGRCDARGEVKLKLLYPHADRRVPVLGRVMHRPPPPVWEEMDVVLDFAKARLVPIPREAGKRRE